MQHLDEGMLMALLDGELKGAEQQETETHLRACAECAARLDELRGYMAEADGLVVAMGEPPALSPKSPSAAAPVGRRINPRTLAWAASIVAALGLGFAGSSLIRSSGMDPNYSQRVAEEPEQLTPQSSPPAAPAEVASRTHRPSPPAQGGAAGSTASRDELLQAEADSARRQLSNEALAVRPNAAAAGQSAIASLDSDLADATPSRDTPSSASESAAKARESARFEEPRAVRSAPLAPSNAAGARRERAAPALQRLAPVFQPVSMEEAVRHLSGVIRLIDGLTPEEFEVAAPDSVQPLVRVLYRVGPAESRLFLEQRRVDNSFVASDLQALTPSVERTQLGNRLLWNDLQGFTLALSGPISPDSLFHFKTLVK